MVAGYRAALKSQGQPQGREQLPFYGGGQLGRDLSLPRLRELWPAPSLEQAGEAAGEWQAAFRRQPPTKVGQEGVTLSKTAPEVARRNLAAFSDRLASVPAADRVAWSVAAREVSGALAAWARVDPANAGVLREAATVVARAAQDRRLATGPAQRGRDSGMAAALVLMAARGDKPQVAAAALMAQLVRAAAAIDYHRTVRNLREATAVDAEVRRLSTLTWTGYAPEPRDSHRLAPLPQPARQQPRNPQPASGLALPKPIEPQPYRGATATPETGRDDAGR